MTMWSYKRELLQTRLMHDLCIKQAIRILMTAEKQCSDNDIEAICMLHNAVSHLIQQLEIR